MTPIDPEEVEEVEPPHFTLGTWKGFTTYQCTKCPFDTMQESMAELHYHQIHVMAEAPAFRPAEALILDHRGDVVEQLPAPRQVSPRSR